MSNNRNINWVTPLVSSILAKTIIAPFQRIKVIMQVHDCSLQQAAFATTTHQNLVLGLWRGHSLVFLQLIPTILSQFVVFHGFVGVAHLVGSDMSPLAVGVAKTLSVIVARCVTYPFEVIQTHLQTDLPGTANTASLENQHKIDPHKGKALIYDGPLDCFMRLRNSPQGFSSFYRGFSIMLLEMIPYQFSAFISHYFLHKQFITSSSPLWQKLAILAVASTIAQIVTYPLDTIRKKYSMAEWTLAHKGLLKDDNDNVLEFSQRMIKEDKVYGGMMLGIGIALCGPFTQQLFFNTLTSITTSSSSSPSSSNK